MVVCGDEHRSLYGYRYIRNGYPSPTHRLGATSLSDCIFVIEEGQVTEEGSHGFLMEKQGIYREMYEKQREWYL